MSNKKAQVGDTIIWVVASIIIFVILFFFIFGSSILGNLKGIDDFRANVFSKTSYQTHDPFLTKSLFTSLQFENVKQGNDLNKKLKRLDEDGKFEEPLSDRLAELKKRVQP